MTSVENSYFKLFMEDLISWKEELFNETNDDEEDVEHLGQTFGLGEGKSLSNCFSPILSLHSLYSTPRKIPNLTLNCKSLGEYEHCLRCTILPKLEQILSQQNTTHHYFCVEQEERRQSKKESISVIRDKFKSVTCLPTYLQSPANLATFPGDISHEENLKMEKENPNFTSLKAPEIAPTPADYDDYDYDTDSDKLSDILEDDLERGSAVLAAFVVTLITMTFFVTLVTMISITMCVSGDYQGRVIAFRLCKQFPDWSSLEGNGGESWCDNKIFNYHFNKEIHCPCFLTNNVSKHTFDAFTLPPFQLDMY